MNTGANYYLIWELAGAKFSPVYNGSFTGSGYTYLCAYFRGDGAAYGYFNLYVDVWRNGNGDYEYREHT